MSTSGLAAVAMAASPDALPLQCPGSLGRRNHRTLGCVGARGNRQPTKPVLPVLLLAPAVEVPRRADRAGGHARPGESGVKEDALGH